MFVLNIDFVGGPVDADAELAESAELAEFAGFLGDVLFAGQWEAIRQVV